MGSRETKKAATRKALVDAAARLFAERGVEATTMDDIAREAGTSRTSVFNYFGYKEMILCEIGARYVAEVAATAEASRSRRRSPRAMLLDIIDNLAEIAERDPVIVAAIARELTHTDPERRRLADATLQYGEFVNVTLDVLEQAGLLRDPGRRPSYIRMSVDMAAGALVRAGGDFPMSQLRTELHHNVDLFMDGAVKPE
ncbi:MAG TPA: helix-turn-helix domain-containing protein [Candidatus Limnocylindria bacterium]|nr:helix-turn-helix domain-containing protein [Candidatus Limnocylindria bacterium]